MFVAMKKISQFLMFTYHIRLDRSTESTAGYQHVLGEIQGVLAEIPFSRLIIVGDLNAYHIRKSSHCSTLEEFISVNGLVMIVSTLPTDTYPFQSVTSHK